MKNNIFLILLFTLTLPVFGQDHPKHRCGQSIVDSVVFHNHPDAQKAKDSFEEKIQKAIQKKSTLKTSVAAEEIITIPVVVHVVHNNSSGNIGGLGNSNISEEQIISQIEVLNEDFRRKNPDTVNTPVVFKSVAADTKIEFALATRDPDGNPTNGITRNYSSAGPFYVDEVDDLSEIAYWDAEEYLNIWVTDISSGTLGFAQFPDETGFSGLSSNNGGALTDGVVMDHNYFGNRVGTATGSSPYTYGRTCVHEVGHWLGLLHVWGNSSCGTDFIDDTPKCTSENYDCPAGQITCDGNRDMVENYMDYTDDQCMNIFTEDQKDRMRAVFEVSPRRKAILTSPGLCGSGLTYYTPFEETFESQSLEEATWVFDTTITDGTYDFYNDGAYGYSNYSFQFVNDGVKAGESYSLVSPVLHMSLSDQPKLEFDYAYTGDGSTTYDSLFIEYDLSCGDTWLPLKEFSTQELVTSTTNSFPFAPNTDEWNTMNIDLNEMANENLVKVRFRFESKGINHFYLDNINFYKVSNNIEVKVFPNPTLGDATLELVYSGEKSFEVQVYDFLGKEYFSNSFNADKSNVYLMPLSGFSVGMYIVRTSVDGEVKTVKFAVTK